MTNTISTFRPFDFKNHFIDVFSDQYLLKESVDDFFIHSLQDQRIQLKLPFPPHRKTVNDFIFVTHGLAKRQLGIAPHTIRKNELMWVPRLLVSTTDFYAPDLEGFYCHFSDDFVGSGTLFLDWQAGNNFNHQIALPHPIASRVSRLLSTMESMYHHGWDKDKEIIAQYLRTVLLEVSAVVKGLPAPAKTSREKELTARYLKLVSTHLKNAYNMRDYADLLNISPNHLNKTIKSTMGKTAQAVYHAIVLQEAKVLLLQTTKDISEIAFELGFQDVSYFGKFFKKLTSSTPLGYRKMIEKNQ